MATYQSEVRSGTHYCYRSDVNINISERKLQIMGLKKPSYVTNKQFTKSVKEITAYGKNT